MQTFGTALAVCLLGIGALCSMGSCCTSQKHSGEAEQRDTLYSKGSYWIVGGRFVENDTLFFLQEWAEEEGKLVRNATIYLEPDSDSYYYTPEYWLLYFNEKNYASQFETWNMYREREHGDALRTVDLFGLPADWIPLHHLDGKPFVLASCEYDYPPQTHLTDSVVAQRGLEMAFLPLRSSEQLSPDCYHFRVGRRIYFQPEEDPITDLYVHRIDARTGAAIWEYRKAEESILHLMVPAASARLFDLVACRDPLWRFMRKSLWQPDEVDLKAVLEAMNAGGKIDIYHLDNSFYKPVAPQK